MHGGQIPEVLVWCHSIMMSYCCFGFFETGTQFRSSGYPGIPYTSGWNLTHGDPPLMFSNARVVGLLDSS